MTDVYLVDPSPTPAWFPFADCRPVSELRAGAWLVRERWEAIADGETRAVFAPPHLTAFVEGDVPPVQIQSGVSGPAIVGRTDFAPSGVAPTLPNQPAQLVNEREVVGWWVPEGERWDLEQSTNEVVEVEGMILHGAYDLVTALEHFLVTDVADFTHERGDPLPEGSLVIGDPADVVTLGAQIEPGVVFDVRAGAVVVEQHAYVRSGTRFEGPVYVGPGTEILGGDIKGSSFGPRCKVRGEIHASVFLGYANKAHEGFLGHSVIGRWVNLGAGTTTSNLKNTYGSVRLEVAGHRIETGRQNLGTLFGDHAKTAIGTMLPTGTAIGWGANVFGDGGRPKYVPPLAWGLEGERMAREGFLAIVDRTLPRRQVEVTDAVRRALLALYDHATAG